MSRTADHFRDQVPHLPDLLVVLASEWRHVGDAQIEVDPFGGHSRALEITQVCMAKFCDRLTGQPGFLRLQPPVCPGDDIAA